jgi:uncharacterized protein (DUF433 family)
MQLEDYFTVHSAEDIRLAGSRIGIEHILYPYIFQARTAEEIAASFPTITLDQVYATILYYLRNKDQVDAYLAAWLAWSRVERDRQAADPTWQAIEQRMQDERARRSQAREAVGREAG